jgi:hypothetical protein
MRYAIVGALFALLPITGYAATVTIPADAAVMSDTPSGKGAANTIVCRAPQKFDDSDKVGPKRCGYNWEWWQLTTHGKDLAADGTTVIERPLLKNPKGLGNPDAVTCRKPKPLPGIGLRYGPEVCETNQFWADLVKDRKMVDANGAVVPLPRWRPTIETYSYMDPRAAYYVGGP